MLTIFVRTQNQISKSITKIENYILTQDLDKVSKNDDIKLFKAI